MDTQIVYIQFEKDGPYLPYTFSSSGIASDEGGCSVVVDGTRYYLSTDINMVEDIYGLVNFNYDSNDYRTVVLAHMYGEDKQEEIEVEVIEHKDYCLITFDNVSDYMRRLHLKAYIDDQFASLPIHEQNGVLQAYVDAAEEVINDNVTKYGARQRTSLADWKLFEQFSIDYPELFIFLALISQDGNAYGRMRSIHERNLSAMQSYWQACDEIWIEDNADGDDKWRVDKWRGVKLSASVNSRYWSHIFVTIDENSPMCDIQLCKVHSSDIEHVTRVDIHETLKYLSFLNIDHSYVEWSIV